MEGLSAPGTAFGLNPVPADVAWPRLRLQWRPLDGGRPAAHAVDAERAEILLIGGGYAIVERSTQTATIWTQESIDEHDLVHPYLGLPAGVVALWEGRTAFHGGGFISGDRAWVVLGDREAGKTTTLAHLHGSGVAVMADDMMVIDAGEAFAGPRTLDLRPATAERWARSSDLVVVRGGERHRLGLPPVPLTVPFGGFVVLERGDELEVATVPVAERFELLQRQHMMGVNNPVPVLDLLAAPMWRLRRPHRWDMLDAAVGALLARLD